MILDFFNKMNKKNNKKYNMYNKKVNKFQKQKINKNYTMNQIRT